MTLTSPNAPAHAFSWTALLATQEKTIKPSPITFRLRSANRLDDGAFEFQHYHRHKQDEKSTEREHTGRLHLQTWGLLLFVGSIGIQSV